VTIARITNLICRGTVLLALVIAAMGLAPGNADNRCRPDDDSIDSILVYKPAIGALPDQTPYSDAQLEAITSMLGDSLTQAYEANGFEVEFFPCLDAQFRRKDARKIDYIGERVLKNVLLEIAERLQAGTGGDIEAAYDIVVVPLRYAALNNDSRIKDDGWLQSVKFPAHKTLVFNDDSVLMVQALVPLAFATKEHIVGGGEWFDVSNHYCIAHYSLELLADRFPNSQPANKLPRELQSMQTHVNAMLTQVGGPIDADMIDTLCAQWKPQGP